MCHKGIQQTIAHCYERSFGPVKNILALSFVVIAAACFSINNPVFAQPNTNSTPEYQTNSSNTQVPSLKPDPAPANAFSQPYGSHLNPILATIGATSSQGIKITTIVESYRSKIDPLRQNYKQKNQVFLTSVIKGLSPSMIMEQQIELSQLYSEITAQYCLLSLQVRRLLKPSQIVLYEEYKHKQGWSVSKTPQNNP